MDRPRRPREEDYTIYLYRDVDFEMKVDNLITLLQEYKGQDAYVEEEADYEGSLHYHICKFDGAGFFKAEVEYELVRKDYERQMIRERLGVK